MVSLGFSLCTRSLASKSVISPRRRGSFESLRSYWSNEASSWAVPPACVRRPERLDVRHGIALAPRQLAEEEPDHDHDQNLTIAGITNNCTMNPAEGASTGGRSIKLRPASGSRGGKSSFGWLILRFGQGQAGGPSAGFVRQATRAGKPPV